MLPTRLTGVQPGPFRRSRAPFQEFLPAKKKLSAIVVAPAVGRKLLLPLLEPLENTYLWNLKRKKEGSGTGTGSEGRSFGTERDGTHRGRHNAQTHNTRRKHNVEIRRPTNRIKSGERGFRGWPIHGSEQNTFGLVLKDFWVEAKILIVL